MVEDDLPEAANKRPELSLSMLLQEIMPAHKTQIINKNFLNMSIL